MFQAYPYCILEKNSSLAKKEHVLLGAFQTANFDNHH